MGKENILITGTAGTGKSEIVRELRDRGYYAHDGDFYAGNEVGDDGEEHWNWDDEAIRKLLHDQTQERMFLAGYAENIRNYLPHFGHIVVLHASAETLTERVQNRTGNAYGQTPEQLAELLAHRANFTDEMLRMGHIAIGVETDVETSVDSILDITGGRDPEPSRLHRRRK